MPLQHCRGGVRNNLMGVNTEYSDTAASERGYNTAGIECWVWSEKLPLGYIKLAEEISRWHAQGLLLSCPYPTHRSL